MTTANTMRTVEEKSYGGETLTPNTPATTLQKSSYLSPEPVAHAQLPTPATQTNDDSTRRRRRHGAGRALRFRFKSEWARLASLWHNLGPSAFSLGTEMDENALRSEVDLSGTYMGSDTDTVDEVIVDRLWSDDVRSGSTPSDVDVNEKRTPVPAAENGQHPSNEPEDKRTEAGGLHGGRMMMLAPLRFVRYRVLSMIWNFFSPKFANSHLEAQYRHETWVVSKPLAALATCFFIINWVLSLSFANGHLVLADKIWYYAVAPVLILPLPIMVIRFDLPRTRPLFYQTFVTFSAWGWALYSLIFIELCGYYNEKHQLWDCGTKDRQDFMALFYFGCAFPVIGLFGLRMNRLNSMFGTLVFTVLACIFIVPELVTFTRNVLNFAIFHAFLLYVHYVKEKSERRLFFLRDKLAVQYKETRAAQLGERKTAESKRRLTSYVFHEVRVPLNTAVLAAQNLEASGTIQKSQKIEFRALSGSLAQMSAVLNDILDFNRMDSGRFEFVARPYSFHQVLRSIFVPLRMSTDARKLHFVTDLDREIDTLARRAALESQGKSENDIARDMLENPDEPGVVVGDEMRLRQVVTNLASNACKFTQPGGELRITTRLLPFGGACTSGPVPPGSEPPPSPCPPGAPVPPAVAAAMGAASPGMLGDTLSIAHLRQHNSEFDGGQEKWIAVRIEVTDTGCGIAPKDMYESKLFSPFNQTEQGRQQGGKGTGLGLAIVRQIVSLSGGRLGVKSKVGEGTTFWVEIPLGIGKRAVVPGSRTMSMEDTDTPLKPIHRLWPANRNGVPTSPRPSLRGVLEDHGSDGRTDPMLSVVNDTGDSSQLMSLARQESALSKASLDEEPAHLPASPLLTPDPNQYTVDPWSPGLKVLVVDDDPLTRTLMKRMLTRLGCHVTTAENGQLALDAINSTTAPLPTPSTFTEESSYGLEARAPSLSSGDFKFALIFLDNQMPVMSGLGAVRKLRAQGGRDFVCGVTGNALLTDQQEFLGAGADYVLTKPVYERDLKKMLTIADKRCKDALAGTIP